MSQHSSFRVPIPVAVLLSTAILLIYNIILYTNGFPAHLLYVAGPLVVINLLGIVAVLIGFLTIKRKY